MTVPARKVSASGSPPAAGVTDHGALTGLNDDDHPQYTTNAEATTIADTEADSKVAAHAAAGNPHPVYTTDAEASAIAAALDHAPVTIGADAEHSLAGQVLSGVD